MTDDAASAALAAPDRAAADGEPLDSALIRLAEEIRRRRRAARLSHADLASRVGYSREYVRQADRPRRGLPSIDLVRALDRALGAEGELLALRDDADRARRGRRRHQGAPLAGLSIPAPAAGLPGLDLDVSGEASDTDAVLAPSARFFGGTTIPVRAYPATDDGRILATVPSGFADDEFLRRTRRGLVVGVTDNRDGVGLFGMDTRQARRRLAGAPDQARLLMPSAYALDDLTFGVLWAVANLDEALSDDDAALSDARSQVRLYEQSPRSAVGREIAADLAPASRMWLGSRFCAGHILRHTDRLAGAPAFWTREQRGEEASTWLLFAHKYDYLRRSGGAASEPDATAPTRAFCIPSSAVSESGRPERILLLLAVALMESFGIVVHICAEPEYAAVPGFVYNGGRNAIMANWVGTDGVWQVDVTDTAPVLRELADTSGYARAHSITAADTPGGRLRALADYLELAWPWLVHRCAELGEYGSRGIARPRSRLLSTDGVDRACRYLAGAASSAG